MLTRGDLIGAEPNDLFDIQAEQVIRETFVLFEDDWRFYMDLRDHLQQGEFEDLLDCLKNAHAVAMGFGSDCIIVAHKMGKAGMEQLVRDAYVDAPLRDLIERWETLISREIELNLTWPVIKVKKAKPPKQKRTKKKSKK